MLIPNARAHPAQPGAPGDYTCRALAASSVSPGVRRGREAARVATDARVAEQRFLSSCWFEIWPRLLLLGEGPCSSVGSPSGTPSRSGEEQRARGLRGRCRSWSVTPALVQEEEEEEEGGTSLAALQAVWRELR